MKKPKSEPLPDAIPYLCEHSIEPFDDCYCRHVTGRTVPNIVMYCMGQYRQCPVYRRRVLHVDKPADDEVNVQPLLKG